MKLVLREFQAHQKLEVDLDAGITSIVGPSDVGKSSILRALRWIMLNNPQGDAFIRDGAKKAEVTIEIDHHKISRIRGGTTNAYLLDGKDLEAFRNDVPVEVQEILKVLTINFQGQHDVPYWFGENAGEVSRQLNRIVNLEIIDQTLQNLNTSLRRAQTEEQILEEHLEQSQVKRTELKYVRDLKQEFEVLEELEQGKDRIREQATRLGDLWQNATTYLSSRDRLTTAAEMAVSTLSLGAQAQE